MACFVFPVQRKRGVRGGIASLDRYDLLAKDLGGLGILYILPDLGSESTYPMYKFLTFIRWSSRLPKSAINESRISMIQILKEMGIHAEARNRNLHNATEKELGKIMSPLETSVDEVIGQGFSQTPRLNPTPNQPDPEIYGHGGTHVEYYSDTQGKSIG